MSIISSFEEKLHIIPAMLYKNYLQHGGEYIARLKANRTLTLEDVVAAAINRGGASYSADILLGAYRELNAEIVYQALDGNAVNNDLWTFYVKLSGTFNSKKEPIEKTKISFVFKALASLRRLTEKVTINITGIANIDAYIDTVYDFYSETSDSELTPGHNIKVEGDRIKIIGDDASIGLYFVKQSDNSRIPVNHHDLPVNSRNELIVLVPTLVPDTYKVEIVTQFTNGSNLLKEPRTITFDKILTVS
jgi:hypothetical protein